MTRLVTEIINPQIWYTSVAKVNSTWGQYDMFALSHYTLPSPYENLQRQISLFWPNRLGTERHTLTLLATFGKTLSHTFSFPSFCLCSFLYLGCLKGPGG